MTTVVKITEWFLLWHLKSSRPRIQQVGCSSAEGLVMRVGGRGRDLARGGGVGAKGWRMGLGVNAKIINPTSAWPEVPIKFIYIFTLRPPLKRLCLDISKQRDVPIYLATKLSKKPGSWDQFIPPWPDGLSAHIFSCSRIRQKDLLLIAGLRKEFLFYYPGSRPCSSPADLRTLEGI